MLRSGGTDDAIYDNNNIKDVASTNLICNKRISVVGLERSAGRPSHKPIRRDLHLENIGVLQQCQRALPQRPLQ